MPCFSDGTNRRDKCDRVVTRELLAEYEVMHDVLVELRVLRKPRNSDRRFDKLETSVGKLVKVGSANLLPFYGNDVSIFESVEAARRDAPATPTPEELLREEFGDGYEEALKRHADVARAINRYRDKDPQLIPLRAAGPPLPAYRDRVPLSIQDGITRKRPPMGKWFDLARREAVRLGVEPLEVLRRLQGRRAPSDDRLKAARLTIAHYLKREGATNAEIGKVLGGIDASAVSRLLAKPYSTGTAEHRWELERRKYAAVQVVAQDLIDETNEGGTE